MGAWGTGPFENDAASDWVYDLEDADDLALALDALARVDTAEYLDADDAAVAIAAAEVLAAAGGRPRGELPPEVSAWVTRTAVSIDAEHAEAASAAIRRVRGDASELAELWAEAGDPGWERELDDLETRLQH